MEGVDVCGTTGFQQYCCRLNVKEALKKPFLHLFTAVQKILPDCLRFESDKFTD